jgi:hypothetical protein
MIVTIHQPEHLPWTGFFHKMAQADVYVLLDTVQFTKNNWQNRNMFVDRMGDKFWITVPVLQKGHTQSTIKDILINPNVAWKRKYLARLESAYCKHPFFCDYFEGFKNIIEERETKLVDLNKKIIDWFRIHLDINTKIIWASELDTQGQRSELLLDICKQLGASSYLSGPSGRDYLDVKLFSDENISLDYHSFVSPVYPSLNFTPYLSTFDLLMNCGPQSRSYFPVPVLS